MTEPINLRVPKSLHPDDVAWAFRYGAAWARYSVLGDASAIRRHGLALTVQYANVHKLGDRVRREATRRLRERVARDHTNGDPCPTCDVSEDAPNPACASWVHPGNGPSQNHEIGSTKP